MSKKEMTDEEVIEVMRQFLNEMNNDREEPHPPEVIEELLEQYRKQLENTRRSRNIKEEE